METKDPQPPILIPYQKISSEALVGLIDEFILREGTDYGTNEVSLEQKRVQISRQLKSQKILIFFHPDSQTTTLTTAEEAKQQLDPQPFF